MLTIHVPIGEEKFDEEKNEFVPPETFTLELEHSLATLSKWESIHEKPFLGPEDKTPEEVYSYIEFMIQTPNFPRGILSQLSEENVEQIQAYISAKRTATWFKTNPHEKPSREIITSELVYYWMTAFSIPFECENWHLNRLLTLIKICNVKNSKPQKTDPREAAERRRALNKQRQQEAGITTT